MGKKKLISRALSALTTLALMLTCIPPNILTTFAAGGGGSGGGLQDGGGTASPVVDDAVNDEDVGLRFSLVTLKDGKAEVVKNIGGTYYFDVWSNAVTPPNYNNVNTTSRYSPLPSKGNITKATVASFDSLIKNYAAKSGGTADFYLSGLLNPGSWSAIFTEANGGFGVYGQAFFNWFMGIGVTINGVDYARYELVMNSLYQGCTAGLNPKNTFLVVEPIVNLCNVDNGWSTTGNRYVASWYGYLTYNISVSKDPGRAYTVRNRLKKIGNGFRLADTAFTADIEKRNKIQEVLGLSIATGDPYGNVNSPAAELFGSVDVAGWGPKMYNNIHETIGLGIQAFWLSGSITDAKTKDPIDTYDIIDQTKNTPTPPEEPSSSDSSDNSDTSTTDDVDTSGDKTIIKLYADLYKDPDTGYYTYIEDIESGDKNTPYAFIETNTSHLVSITNEENINGYKASAWYTSKTQYEPNSSTNNDLLKASNMIAVTDFAPNTSDGKVTLDNFGGKQLRVDKYQPAYQSSNKAGYNSYEGCQKFFTSLPQPHGTHGNGLNAQKSTGATNYTDYKRLETKGTSNYGTYDYPVNEEGTKIDLGDAETIIILYTREKIDISTSDLTTDETIPDTPDDRKDRSGNLTIVKLYGVINPNTYDITADPSKSSVVVKNATRNVNINSEPGYNFAEWIYVTGGAPTDLTAQKMGTTNLSNIELDGTVDQAYRLDGFVDGFKNNANLEKYFRFSIGGKLQLPTINTISVGGINSSTVAGRYSYGSRSGIGTGSYNSTIYLGGDKLSDGTADDVDNNDVLYLLFLKTDQLSYSSDDLVIPESYITRYDNYKHNPMTVTGSISGTTYDELLQQHKFRYVLPVVADGTEYIDVNPLFIPHIALTNKNQAGLVSGETSVHRLQSTTNLTTLGKTYEVIKAYTDPKYTGVSDYAQLIYLDQGYVISSSDTTKGKQYVGSMLNVSALNLDYTAYRHGDRVKVADWKYNNIASVMSGSSPLSVTDTKKLLADVAIGNVDDAVTSLIASGAVSSSTSARKPNNSSQTFKLNFEFSEVGDGIKSIYLLSDKAMYKNTTTEMNGVDQPKQLTVDNTVLNLFKTADSFYSYKYAGSDVRLLSRVESAQFSDETRDNYAIHSLNRLFEVKESDGSWSYKSGITSYLSDISDVNITQNVQYDVHYGSAKTNNYKDKVESGNGTDTSRGQYGYVRSMKANNTITFYPYHVMQYELPESYNATINKDGTLKSESDIKSQNLGNNANQLYVMGEEERQLNIYEYAEVSYYDHSVSSSKGIDVVNNVINTNRNGRIELSSEQWSTHARASSLIGLNNCALPGGATLSITIPAANRQTVTITSYSALLPTESAGYSQVLAYANMTGNTAAFGNVATNTTDALNRHNMFVESVAAGFEGLNVEQYFSDTNNKFSNTKDGGTTYDAANTVYEQIKGKLPSGSNLYNAKGTKVYSVTDFTGKEDKYYYRPDGDVKFDAKGSASTIDIGKYNLAAGNNKDGDGNTGDFDTDYEDKLSTNTVTYYTFYMNRTGQVLCIKDSTTAKSAKANLTGTATGDGAVLVANWAPTDPKGFTYTSGLASDIKLAAQNTGIVEELYKQLEVGTGKDASTAWSKNNPNGEWYFEAFDGLTVAKFETKLSVGFIDPYERTSVLDPEVIPTMNGKGDMLTSSIMSQVVTSDTSLMYGTPNKIGEFCDASGNKIGDIIMPDLRSFFISDIFFAPNITVQDLK